MVKKVKKSPRPGAITPAIWASIKKMLDSGKHTATSLAAKLDIPVGRIYSRQRLWRLQAYKKNPKYQDPRYVAWRTFCLKRDKYTCRHCKRSKEDHPRTIFQVDHIKPWSTFPELRYLTSNGRTLCIRCHKKTPTFGRNALKYRPK